VGRWAWWVGGSVGGLVGGSVGGQTARMYSCMQKWAAGRCVRSIFGVSALPMRSYLNLKLGTEQTPKDIETLYCLVSTHVESMENKYTSR
jgi:hypothetical protein